MKIDVWKVIANRRTIGDTLGEIKAIVTDTYRAFVQAKADDKISLEEAVSLIAQAREMFRTLQQRWHLLLSLVAK